MGTAQGGKSFGPEKYNCIPMFGSLRHTFATNLINGVKQPDGTIKALTVKQVADLLGHSTTQVIEMYYVKKDTSRLSGITNDFCL